MFKDVDQNHWAYQAVENLRAKNIVVGYPDGYFRGKRTLTRYEFAVALDRLLKSLPGNGRANKGDKGDQGEKGDKGDAGEKVEQGPPGMTPEEVATLRRLTQEFRDELGAAGQFGQGDQSPSSMRSAARRRHRAQINAMPKIYGGLFVGVRSDRANGSMSIMTAV